MAESQRDKLFLSAHVCDGLHRGMQPKIYDQMDPMCGSYMPINMSSLLCMQTPSVV